MINIVENVKKVASTQCPTCDSKLNAATSTSDDDSAPTKGDLSICLYCASTLMFMGDGKLINIDMKDIPKKYRKIMTEQQTMVKNMLKFSA